MADTANTSDPIADLLDPARARALQATLGETPTLCSGDTLPPFYHQIYFWDPQPAPVLDRDGHPNPGGLIPDMGDATRMWAGGKLVQHQPLKAGIKAARTSRVEGMTRKQGKSGTLTFVRLRHDIRQRHALVVTEFQDIVYRAANAPPSTAQPAPTVADHSEPLRFDATQVFRYSALTFNGHRIHYDADYARDVEGYPACVIHSPLLTQMMLACATRLYGAIGSFSYRNTSPLKVDEPATLCAKDGQIWIKAADGRLCASGLVDRA